MLFWKKLRMASKKMPAAQQFGLYTLQQVMLFYLFIDFSRLVICVVAHVCAREQRMCS